MSDNTQNPEKIAEQGGQVDAIVSQRPQYTLSWGIHAGTLTSRDVGESYKFDTEQECIDKAHKLQSHYKNMGYKIWYANVINPDGTSRNIISTPYY